MVADLVVILFLSGFLNSDALYGAEALKLEGVLQYVPPTSEEEAEGTEICLKSGFVCPEIDGDYVLFAGLQNCTQFCECKGGRPYLKNCPSGLHFNLELDVCDYPHKCDCSDGLRAQRYVTGKLVVKRPDPDQVQQGSEICYATNIECPAVDGDEPVYGTLKNCSQFCQCAKGVPYLKYCPSGLYFNPASDRCDWPRQCECDQYGNRIY